MYILYLIVFTNNPIICESMINLSEQMKNKNQYISYTDKNKQNYVMIRLNDLKNTNGESDRELMSKVYESISKSEEGYDKLSGQDSHLIIESLKKGYTQIIREPILAIKSSDVEVLTKNNILSGSVRNITDTDSILIPFSSKIVNFNLDGKIINGKIIKLDKLLYLEEDSKTPSFIKGLNKIYLQPIYQTNGKDIYIIKEIGNPDYEINLI